MTLLPSMMMKNLMKFLNNFSLWAWTTKMRVEIIMKDLCESVLDLVIEVRPSLSQNVGFNCFSEKVLKMINDYFFLVPIFLFLRYLNSWPGFFGHAEKWCGMLWCHRFKKLWCHRLTRKIIIFIVSNISRIEKTEDKTKKNDEEANPRPFYKK